MNRVGLNEAKTHLSELVAKVSNGDEFVITKRGTPVARLVPAEQPARGNVKKALARAKELRETLSLDGMSIKELINEGQRV